MMRQGKTKPNDPITLLVALSLTHTRTRTTIYIYIHSLYIYLSPRYPATDQCNRYMKLRTKVFSGHNQGCSGTSPFRDNTNRSRSNASKAKQGHGRRLKWTKDTPTKNRREERVIRRLGQWEKDRLYSDRPDLDPSDGYFDMGAWMNGCSQDEEEDEDCMERYDDDDVDYESDDSDSCMECEDADEDAMSDDEYDLENRCGNQELENDENNNVVANAKSFLGKIMSVAGA